MEPRERIIVALDVDNLSDAEVLVEVLHPCVGYFKVGLQLLTSEGAPKVISTLHRRGAKIFYDGKFMDIPNTVAGASRAVAKLGVDMFNVHASGGEEMIRAAVENKGNSKVLAVTVLTSLGNYACALIFGCSPESKVIHLAHMAVSAGVDGVICSPKEVSSFRAQFSEDVIVVTPGVRPAWAAKGDQARVMTPGEAIKAGADYLVIGRPITQPPIEVGSSVDAAILIATEIKDAM